MSFRFGFSQGRNGAETAEVMWVDPVTATGRSDRHPAAEPRDPFIEMALVLLDPAVEPRDPFFDIDPVLLDPAVKPRDDSFCWQS